jgi:hypothetical protein
MSWMPIMRINMDQRIFRRDPNGKEMEEEICDRGSNSPANQARPPAKANVPMMLW